MRQHFLIFLPEPQGHGSLRPTLEVLAAARYVDRRSLVVLDASVRGFAAQAEALVVMMAERDAPDDLVDAAEELVDFFQGARERIETMLTLGHG